MVLPAPDTDAFGQRYMLRKMPVTGIMNNEK